ncbi:GGDEF domain-containing protein [Rhodanobacter sp. MP7CTX1]|uniref:GGDEF domain-containing protein n=1 Tax=Rhodanobacter sp. MP7CTX1 TaxID=2723084 RepID=UPI001613059B|nr:GGDEF domain-containing protein [Rhodanobacter sp. MP7CTX1]MBB6188151.1 diguanylate cyclase (GGDEF)-like protein [Rhodanobacter sp. MP7CTX1]
MHALSISPQHSCEPDQRREYTQYLAQRMRPMIQALMLVACLAYVAATAASTLVAASSLPLLLRLTPALPLLLVATAATRVRRPLSLSLLALSCVLLLEIGINLNGMGHVRGQPWVLPGLLLPVASSVIWLGLWDFTVAMALCAFGPLSMLVLGAADGVQIVQYAVYMAIAISLSAVLRAFMARTLFEQFRLERQLREQANTDGLTGLLLRNRFLELARLALGEAHRQQKPASTLFLDADHFKQLNDDHGHAAGDAALIALAATLRAQMRKSDLIGRIGGEEFAMLLPGLDLHQASRRAEQLRLAVHAVQRPDGPLTVSIGVAECLHAAENIEALLARADQAMRRAKFDGRDRAVNAH